MRGMIVYSQNILRFIGVLKEEIKEILRRETSFEVHRERFSDARQRSYPLNVVIFNHKKSLGYFDPGFYEMGFHIQLMHASAEQRHQVIRHELAHYFTYIQHKQPDLLPHGPEFVATCVKLGWGEDVSAAGMCLDAPIFGKGVEESSILRKVQKLMSLTASSNSHEAEVAMLKSQQLLLKYNLNEGCSGSDDGEVVVLKRILKRRKMDAQLSSIGRILNTFFVSCVYSRGGDWLYLEVSGKLSNVEIAEYVALFLEEKMPILWQAAQRDFKLKGLTARNSFLVGLAQGYCAKVKAFEREYSQETTQALMVIEKALIDAKEMIYPRLSQSRSSGKHCSKAAAIGESIGRNLNINPALTRHSTPNRGFLLK